ATPTMQAARRGALAPGLLLGLCCIVILAHLTLIPDARWTSDEFKLLARVPDSTYLARILGWSPRPFSEAFLIVYQQAVWTLRRPLVTPVLAVLWLLLLSAPMSAGLLCKGRERRAFGAVFDACALLAVCLLAAKPGEMFYWPAGAAAYLPSLAAMLYVSVMAARVEGWSRVPASPLALRVGLLVWLLIGAASSEVGAAFALLLGALSCLTSGRRGWAAGWAWLPPMLLAVLALLIFDHYRGNGTDVMAPHSATLGHFATSFVASVPSYLAEFAHGEWVDGGAGVVLLCLGTRLLLLVGFRPVGNPAGRKSPAARAADLAPILALLGAGFVSVLAAYLKFGLVCCERHQTMRQDIFVLALYNVAVLMPLAPAARRARRFGNVALAAALVVLMVMRYPEWLHDLGIVPEVTAAKTETWRSGLSAGREMTYYVGPQPQVAGGGWFPPAGRYVLTAQGTVRAADGGEIAAVAKFFGKRALDVR
ncbi:MAG: hypothetical protein ACREF1_14285, partial [Acetobacteraceae bacterium]